MERSTYITDLACIYFFLKIVKSYIFVNKKRVFSTKFLEQTRGIQSICKGLVCFRTDNIQK